MPLLGNETISNVSICTKHSVAFTTQLASVCDESEILYKTPINFASGRLRCYCDVAPNLRSHEHRLNPADKLKVFSCLVLPPRYISFKTRLPTYYFFQEALLFEDFHVLCFGKFSAAVAKGTSFELSAPCKDLWY